MTLNERAATNFAWLRGNPYPGRGFVVGFSDTRKTLWQLYFLMGRSANSRARMLKQTGNCVHTVATDPSKLTDPSLVIYNVMKERDGVHAISNGIQTDALAELNRHGHGIESALRDFSYEPDAPHYTPRISGYCTDEAVIEIAILRKACSSNVCQRKSYSCTNTPPGFGYCLTTYAGDGEVLPTFLQEPLLMPLSGNMEEIAMQYWTALNEENRVSLAIKAIDLQTGLSRVRIINKYNEV